MAFDLLVSNRPQTAPAQRAMGRARLAVRREGGESRFSTLRARDSITYEGRVEHRFRQVGAQTCVVLLVHTASGRRRGG